MKQYLKIKEKQVQLLPRFYVHFLICPLDGDNDMAIHPAS